MTGKQRAYLRSLANQCNPIFQIGKEGINEKQVKGIDEYLIVHELVKINILESAGLVTRQACDTLAQLLGAQPVQCIGRKIVLYRESPDDKRIKLP